MYCHSALLLAGAAAERLPDIQGYIFTPDDLEKFTNSYTPPTLAQIFSGWGRFCYNAYYPPNTTPAGEAAAWEMMNANQFRCTVNSNYLTGFVSPETFTHYTHQADLSSTDGDDDHIGLVIAFARVNNYNHVLSAERLPGGAAGYPATRYFTIMHQWDDSSGMHYEILKVASGTKCDLGSGYHGWNVSSPTRVKIIREGNKITAQSSPFCSTDLAAGEEIIFNLDEFPQLAWAKEKLSYGYCCWSQNYSSFSNVDFSGAGELDANFLYDLDTGDVLAYTNGRWQVTGDKIWDHLGHPRKIVNPKNGKEYMIGYESITEIL